MPAQKLPEHLFELSDEKREFTRIITNFFVTLFVTTNPK